MAIDNSKKSIITYRQASTPVSQKSGEAWYNTTLDETSIYNGTFNAKIAKKNTSPVISVGSKGYVLGGPTTNSGTWYGIESITFSNNDAISVVNSNLVSISDHPGCCNSSEFGYMASSNTIYRMFYKYDVGNAFINTGLLSNSNIYEESSCNSSRHGYFIGGYYSGSVYSTIDRITFPYDAGNASHVGDLTYRSRLTKSVNSSQYGYTCSGQYDTTVVSYVHGFQFPFDSGIASMVANTYSNGDHSFSMCNSSQYGYTLGGGAYNSNYYSFISKLNFPFSGTFASSGNLSGTSYNGSALNSSTKGYQTGGFTTGGSTAKVDSILFPFNSGTATNIGSLVVDRRYHGTCDETDFITQFV